MINNAYTYIISTLRSQSWVVGRDSRANFDAETNTDYAPYQGKAMTDLLAGSSSNSVKTLYRDKHVDATYGNYGMEFFYLSAAIDNKTDRLQTDFSFSEIIASDFRQELDTSGNNNDLYLFNMALGGLGNSQNSDLDLNANSEEYLKYQVDKLRDLCVELQENGEQPYVIFINCQSLSSDSDPAANADRILDINYYWQQRMGSTAPVVEFPVVWSGNTHNETDVYVNNNYNVEYCGGLLTKSDVVSSIESDEPTIDGSDPNTYTIDLLHFNYKVDFRQGLLGLQSVINKADGFHYTVQT